MATAVRGPNHFQTGLMFAIGSAFAFGMSGPLAKSLITAGWSPTGAVSVRLAGGAIVMVIVATFLHPSWIREVKAHARTIVAYGVIPITGAQLCYYNAIAHLPVSVAMLLEYIAPILVVSWIWVSTGRRPHIKTLIGVALAIIGIMGVLNIFTDIATALTAVESAANPATTPTGASTNTVGIIWGLGAAICAACYFLIADKVDNGHGTATNSDNRGSNTSHSSGLHAITLTTGGLIVGAVAIAIIGGLNILPLTLTSSPTTLAGMTMSPLLPVIALAIVPTAIAYTLGVHAVVRLKPSFASLVGLAEVLFTVLMAWMLLNEAITITQAIGGVVMLSGLALARQGDRDNHPAGQLIEERTANDVRPTTTVCDY